MKILALAASLAVSPPLLLGAPSSFTVTGTEVDCVLHDATADLRVSWDLAVEDPACGWLCGDLPRLPAASEDRSVVLRVDGKEYPCRFAEADGRWRVGMDHENRARFDREPGEAKSVRLETVFRRVPVVEGRLAVALDGLRPLWREEAAAPRAVPLRVRIARGVRKGFDLEATFERCSPGSGLEIASGEDALGVRLLSPTAGEGRPVADR